MIFGLLFLSHVEGEMMMARFQKNEVKDTSLNAISLSINL